MIDLHTHSSRSDGSLAPEELVELAHRTGLTAIALTDHDILAGNAAADQRARELELRFIPGVEIEINSTDGTFHLLGLNLTGDTGLFEKRLREIRELRATRNDHIAFKMRQNGVSATADDFKSFAKGEVVSRLHIAQFLVARGIARTVPDAFDRLLSRGKPFYEPKEALSLAEGVHLIHAADGYAVMAHPFSLRQRVEELEPVLLDFKTHGLDGIEAHHSDYPPDACRTLEELGRGHGFLITAGSDFHGVSWPKRRLGHSAGGTAIDDRYLPF